MPLYLQAVLSPEQRQVLKDIQEEPGPSRERRFVIPRVKIADPAFLETIKRYIDEIVEDAAGCAQVLMSTTQGIPESHDHPKTLHKWDPRKKPGVRASP